MTHPEPVPAPGQPLRRSLGPTERFLVWTVLCGVSAAPSFYCAFREWDPWGIVAGIFTYVLLYTCISGTEFVRRLRDDPAMEWALRIGYGTRLVLSAAYPIGLGLDVLTGIFSVGLAEALWGKSRGFAASFGTTLVHGTLMNVLLAVYMFIVFGFALLALPKRVPEGICRQCGYDLRGSRMSARCSECGTPTPWANQVSNRGTTDVT